MEKIQKVKKLFEDIKKEVLNVTWPDRKEMTTAITIVAISVILAGSAFFAVDYFLYKFVQFLIEA